MELKDFLRSLPDEVAREEFAESCETTLGHMRNCIYATKPKKALAPATCVLVERFSGHAVKRWELRPDDWHKIWPELRTRQDAPAIATAV